MLLGSSISSFAGRQAQCGPLACPAPLAGTRPLAARRPLTWAPTCQAAAPAFLQAAEGSTAWRIKQGRRLLLLKAHEQKLGARGAPAPPATPPAGPLAVLEGAAAAQVGALVAHMAGNSATPPAQTPAEKRVQQQRRRWRRRGSPPAGSSASGGPALASSGATAGKAAASRAANNVVTAPSSSSPKDGKAASSATTSSSAASASPPALAATQSGEAPKLPKPWHQMDTDSRRAYLVAVRDHYGEGVLYERRLQSGRTVLALFDPHMRPQLGAHVWSERAHGRFGGLYTETGPHAGRTSLARWTAEECLLGASQVALGVVGWRHKDACPANCLARNLEVQLAATVPEAAPLRQHTARQARQAARAALQQLYAAVGAEEGRRFLQALHKEQQVLQAAAH